MTRLWEEIRLPLLAAKYLAWGPSSGHSTAYDRQLTKETIMVSQTEVNDTEDIVVPQSSIELLRDPHGDNNYQLRHFTGTLLLSQDDVHEVYHQLDQFLYPNRGFESELDVAPEGYTTEKVSGAETALGHLRERLNEREYDNASEDEFAPGYEAALADLQLLIDKLKTEG